MAYLVPVFSSISAKARVIFCARWSKLPAQPTQNKTSGVSPFANIDAITGTSIIQNLRKSKSNARYAFELLPE
jgi:hypothetical protein